MYEKHEKIKLPHHSGYKIVNITRFRSINYRHFKVLSCTKECERHAVAQLVETLGYEPEGRGFPS
jgi:hypothetical protein